MTINSVDILRRITLQNSSIHNLLFYEFGEYELIQNRINLINPLDEVFEDALHIREKYNSPFWDSFNLSLFDREIENFEFLKEINFHNLPQNKIYIKRDNFLNDKIEFQNYTTICSLINDENSNRHIFLLDFHIPQSTNNQKICINIINHLKLKGYLLDSGKSYHFIGSEILCFEKLQETLYNALLFSPIIDKSWIAHQLIQKACCLRVSKKYERLPFLIKEV